MRILVDENIPWLTVQTLREAGHDVRDVRNTDFQGAPDTDLWREAQQDKRLLITTDKGFVQQRLEDHHGILVVRLHQPNRARIHQRVMQAMRRYTEQDWPGLTVVMRDEVQSVWRTSAT